MAAGIQLLHKEFERRQLTGRIAICGPGSVPNASVPQYREIWKGSLWTDYASDAVGELLGAYNTHAYYPHRAARERSAAEYLFLDKDVAIACREGKPFFLGEIGLKATKDGGELAAEHERRRLAKGNASTDSNMFIYDYFYGLDMASVAIQSMNSGVDAMAAWDVDDAMHTKNDLADKRDIKRWGFWNILGTELYNDPADEQIRPWYWAWSWLCRYLPPHSQLFVTPQPANRAVSCCRPAYRAATPSAPSTPRSSPLHSPCAARASRRCDRCTGWSTTNASPPRSIHTANPSSRRWTSDEDTGWRCPPRPSSC